MTKRRRKRRRRKRRMRERGRVEGENGERGRRIETGRKRMSEGEQEKA